MLNLRFVAQISFIGATTLGAAIVPALDYPNKPIRVVTSEIGGGSDFMTRIIAQGVTGPLGQPLVIENRASRLTSEIVAKSVPDGYTVLFAGGVFVFAPLLGKMNYDPVKDFSPITVAVTAPNIVVVHPSVAVKSVKELIALAKARPGQLNYGSGGLGGTPHLAAELFKSMAGVDIVGIAYKGTGPSVNALVGGEVQLMFATAGSVAPHVKSDRLRVLAVTSLRPSELFPGLPTVAATGLPGYDSATIYGVLVPVKTPVSVINRLHQEIVRFLKIPDTKVRFLNAGVEPVGSSPAEFAAIIQADMTRMGKVIKDAGIKVD